MEYLFAREEDIDVMIMEGELTLPELAPVREAVKERIADNKEVKKLIIDMEKVGFIDSSGIGFIISTFKKIRSRSGRFALSGLRGIVEESFRTTGIDRVIDIYDTLGEAIAILKKPKTN